MTLKEIYETGAIYKELTKLLNENGYSYADYCNWIEFAKAMGYIK